MSVKYIIFVATERRRNLVTITFSVIQRKRKARGPFNFILIQKMFYTNYIIQKVM